ncbi:histidine phosphatase family protein [Corynebacterium uropygiale]|uniref:Histidine phosphatase family protein n=1 Tax=Corynebacterium uropygiale TaxID=1775911 RepID=A0A9X1QPU1_9CORY|nr:histidine phosphatase family protein [Corynebacterium uropygiale]MCF4007377.1 histidine phosphatase family protein [Corynebacterium uropygiale]
MTTGRIVLMRHGETTSNVASVLDSRPPGAWLTAQGEEQARRAGRRFAEEGWDFEGLYCSIAIRAGQTATLLREEYEKVRGLEPYSVPLEPLLGVHEIDMGDLEMHGEPEAFDLYNSMLWAWFGGDASRRMPGGENYEDVLARYRPALESVHAAHPEGDVLIVSHGASIRTAAVHACGIDPAFAVENRLPNCTRVVMRPEGRPYGQWSMEAWAE